VGPQIYYATKIAESGSPLFLVYNLDRFLHIYYHNRGYTGHGVWYTLCAESRKCSLRKDPAMKAKNKVVVFFEEPELKRGVRGGWAVEVIVRKDFLSAHNLDKPDAVRLGRRVARNLGLSFSINRK
jgi:hypothetical protein